MHRFHILLVIVFVAAGVAAPQAHGQTSTLYAGNGGSAFAWNNAGALATGTGLSINLTLGIEYLIVGGGGGGGGGIPGGGGGGGGVLTGTLGRNPQTFPNPFYQNPVAGQGGFNGGSAAQNGGDVQLFGFTAFGGGAGAGSSLGQTARSGGSGGGGVTDGSNRAGAAGTTGQGFAGGTGGAGGLFGTGAGGGGAASSGTNANAAGTSRGGAGGMGVVSTITGTSVTYGSGGGGGGSAGGGSVSSGGGAGAASGNGTAGTAGVGGGGGGAYNGNGGNGGLGAAIFRYLSDANLFNVITSPSVITVNGQTYRLHNLTAINAFNNVSLTYNIANLFATQSTAITGTGRLTFDSAGTLILTASNTYSGGTTISAGTLQVGASGTTGGLGPGTVTNNATLAFNRSDAVAFADAITGTGSLIQRGSGVLELTAANTYSGPTTISSGTLQIGEGGTLGSGTVFNNAALVFSRPDSLTAANAISGTGSLTKLLSGTVTLSGTNSYSGGTTVSAGRLVGTTSSLQGTITNNAAVTFDQSTSGTYAGSMAGTGSLVKSGLGTVTFSGSNAIAGGVAINAGTLAVGSANALGSSGTISFGGGTLQYTASNATDYSSRFSNDAGQVYAIDTNGRNVTLAAALTSSGGSFAKLGSGTLTLGGANTYDAGTVVSGGRLVGTTDSLQGAITNNAAVEFAQATSGSYAGNMSGSGSLTKSGAGGLTLSGNNSFSGGAALNGGTLTVGSANALGSAGTISFGGGTLQYSAANTTDFSARFSTAASQAYAIDTNGQNVSLATALTSSGGSLTKSGLGTLTLTGNNTYSGTTAISGGTLQVGNGGATGELGGSGSVTNDGVLAVNRSNAFSFARAITGSGAFHQLGGGTTTLSGSNSYSGGTVVSAGRLVGTAASLQGAITNNAAVEFAQATSGTFAGSIDGSGSLTKSGAGALTISGSNTFTGASRVEAGTLALGSGGSFAAGSSLEMFAGGTFDLAGRSQTFAGVSGTGGTIALTGSQAGGNSLVIAYMNGANSTNGTLTIDGDSAVVSVRSTAAAPRITWSWGGSGVANGTLNLARGELQYAADFVDSGAGSVTASFNLGGPSGTATIRPVGSNGLVLSAAITRTLLGSNGVISSTDADGIARSVTVNGAIGESGGSRGLSFAGSGTTTITGTNTYSGTTWLRGGTLRTSSTTPFLNSPLEISAGATFVTGTSGVATYSIVGLSGSGTVSLGGNTLQVGSNNDSTTYSGIVTGASGGLVKVGTGSLALTAVQAFTGATTISGGRLEIGAAGGINSSSGITIDGGELRYNSATTLTKPITFTAGTISGTGTIGTAVTVAAGDFVSPGNSPGTQSYTSLHAWAPGGTYQWELNGLSGAAGTAWDLINVTSGTFNLSALNTSPGNQFVLDLITLDALNAPGPLASPFDGGSYTFAIASYNPSAFVLPAGLGLTNTPGTDLTSLFQINLGNWQGTKPELGNISVKINSAANGIDLVIVPEPATLMLVAGGVAAMAVRLRRRASCRSSGR